MDRYDAEEIEYRKEESEMNDYNRGKRDMMMEMAKSDLEETATRIAILEEDLYEARKKKWELVNKMRLLEEGAAFECLDEGEPLTLHEKIAIIKSDFSKKCLDTIGVM